VSRFDAPPVRSEVAGGVARITLDRPGAMNAVTVDLAQCLEEVLLVAGEHPDVKVVLVRGAGGNFCAGGDFEEVGRLRAAGPQALRTLFLAFGAACAAVDRIAQPVVVAVDGIAMAGGFELMQAADVVLVRDDARICDNHVNFGMVPGGGGSQRLPRLVGRQRALGHLLSGDRLSGIDAVAWGLAYRSFAPDDFDHSVEQFVTTMAGRNPASLARIKRLVREGLKGPLDVGLSAETDAVVEHITGVAGAASFASFARRKEG
jgi:enoyl-CoA hydratase/carnithine racemase